MSDSAGVELQQITATCPHCGYRHDAHAEAHTGVDVAAPPSGSLSICLACGGLSLFVDGALVRPTRAEADELVQDRRIRQVIIARAVVFSAGGGLTTKPVWP